MLPNQCLFNECKRAANCNAHASHTECLPSHMPFHTLQSRSKTTENIYVSRCGWQFAKSGLLSSRLFGASRFCTRSNVFTFGSYQKGKMSDDPCVAMCRSQTFDLGPLDKRRAIRVGSLSNHGATAEGMDVGWDDEAPPGNPRCCMRLNKSLSLNFTAIV
jgi:hypothetical protein